MVSRLVFDTDMPRVAFFVPKTKTNFYFQDGRFFIFIPVIGIYDNSILVIFPSWRELSRGKKVRFSLSFHRFRSKSCDFTIGF